MMPLTTIAIDLGFSSSQHFSTVFRKMEGMAPSEYRRTQTQEERGGCRS